MKKYLYFVSFFTLMATVLGLVLTVKSVDDFVFPTMSQTTISTMYAYDYYTSSTSTAASKANAAAMEKRKKETELSLSNERKKGIIDSAAVALIPFGIFLIHWKFLLNIRKREEEKKIEEVDNDSDE